MKNQTTVLKDIPEEIAVQIKKDHPEYSDETVIDFADIQNYRLSIIEKQMKHQTTLIGKSDKKILQSMRNNQFISLETKNDDTKLTLGQRTADAIARFGGSWVFIIIFISILCIWITLNATALLFVPFDPYPFILLNLALSCLAAVQAPIIMMSQNRQEERDRKQSIHDYEVNMKSEIEIRLLHEKLDHLIYAQMKQLQDTQNLQMEYLKEIRDELNMKNDK
jgi:uncharacterized membrane protein